MAIRGAFGVEFGTMFIRYGISLNSMTEDLGSVTGDDVKNIIRVEDLHHSFDELVAVDGISFDVREGEIFSFLGPNGAGKSTTINILITLLPLQKGTVVINGHDLREGPIAIRHDIGVVFQDTVLDYELTCWETMEFHGRINDMPRDIREERIKELLEVVELTEKWDVQVKNLSGGMKRRLEIARGLLTRPRVLFLDEPTIGLDPQTRLRIWEYIKMVNRKGTTVFLTTHYMDEADALSDIINIIDHGKIIATGTATELKDRLGEDMVYLECDDLDLAKTELEGMEEVTEVRPTSKGLQVILATEGSRFLPTLIERMAAADLHVNSVNLKKPSLDDVFVHFTGKDLRDGDAGGPGGPGGGPGAGGKGGRGGIFGRRKKGGGMAGRPHPRGRR